jgi:CRISPR-associated protein Csb1
MNQDIDLNQFDTWISYDSAKAALVIRQWYVPVEGSGAVIFPPTYAAPLDGKAKDDWSGYNIDHLPDGSTVCQIDSVGSQANRMEPIFKHKDYADLVPQIEVTTKGKSINLLDAGHRAADAIVRYSKHGKEIGSAFEAIREHGDTTKLAKIAPTSIVFGSWDSRASGTKLPRIVRSVIRAYNVDRLHRSAQYTTVAGQILSELDADTADKEVKSGLGFAHVPAAWTHGGVILRKDGEIRRDASVNFVAIRALGGTDPNAKSSDEITMTLRRYILGLTLVSITALQDTALREGCHLVPDIQRPSVWEVVNLDGTREDFSISREAALKFAKAAAEQFGVGSGSSAAFDLEAAKSALKSVEKSKSDSKSRKTRS